MFPPLGLPNSRGLFGCLLGPLQLADSGVNPSWELGQNQQVVPAEGLCLLPLPAPIAIDPREGTVVPCSSCNFVLPNHLLDSTKPTTGGRSRVQGRRLQIVGMCKAMVTGGPKGDESASKGRKERTIRISAWGKLQGRQSPQEGGDNDPG